MGNVRRFVLLSVLALLISAAAAVVMPKANASPAPPAPVQMNYACALKSNGLLRYVTSTSKCAEAMSAPQAAAGSRERLNPGVESKCQPGLPPVGRRRARGPGSTLTA